MIEPDGRNGNLDSEDARGEWEEANRPAPSPSVPASPSETQGVREAAPAEKPLDLDEAEKQIEIAATTLGSFCKEVWAGRIKEAWHWEIPANPARDTDLLIGAAISVAAKAVKELRVLRAALSHPQPSPTKEKP